MSFCRLRLIAPVIKDHGIDYERGKFQDRLNDGSLTLERTQALIESIIKQGVTQGRFPLHDLADGNAVVYSRVHSAALVNLISRDILRNADIPETLLMDVERLKIMHKSFSSLVCKISTAIATTQGLCSGNKREEKPEEKKKLLSEFYDYLACDTEFDIETSLLELGSKLDEIGILAEDNLR